MKINVTEVKRDNLGSWMNDCYERGCDVRFVVPCKSLVGLRSGEGIVTTYLVTWKEADAD